MVMVVVVLMVLMVVVMAGVCSVILGARVKANTLVGSFLLPMPSASSRLWR